MVPQFLKGILCFISTKERKDTNKLMLLPSTLSHIFFHVEQVEIVVCQ